MKLHARGNLELSDLNEFEFILSVMVAWFIAGMH